MKKILTILLIILIGYLPNVTFAQDIPDSTQLHLIETIGGNQYIGIILEENLSIVKIKTDELGEITLNRNIIKKIEPIERKQMIGNEYWFENPQATRYFWAPNGYGLRKGEGYYQNVWLFFNQFAFGLTDNLSLGAGIVPAFLFAGAPTPVWLTPKFSIPVVKDKFNIGAGALLGTVIGAEDANFGILYGIATFGSRDKNLSIGLGYGYAGGEMAKAPAINVNAMIRISKGSYFMTENYYIPRDLAIALISLGGRSMVRNVGLDYGLFIPIVSNMSTFVAIPWLGITVPFGKKK